ncbi:hypothetical protein DDE82_008149 [Stemphylium lycopersici]|nr:hypothetical protein DDE82_008149 [Stemphylium lycopersici]
MKGSPHNSKPSLGKSNYGASDSVPERHLYTPSSIGNVYSHIEEAIEGTEDMGGLHGHRESINQRLGNANDLGQSHTPNLGFDMEEIATRDLYSSIQKQRPATQRDSTIRRGVWNYSERSSPGCLSRDFGDNPSGAYMMHRRSFSVEGPSVASMSSMQQPSSRNSSSPPQVSGKRYGPFLGRFRNSEDAKVYRRDRMRFGRMPWRDPASDPTIVKTEENRVFNVERIYNAMVCGDFARDNAKSTALKRWVHEPHYQSDLVEAYAHKVFDCLLEQVKGGFRGWHQNDYVNDERKGEDDDKDVDCAGRLENIIAALQQEKSICENVMSSAWQIRMFVNAPKAYAKRKDQNRVGNSKRPNAKDSETMDYSPRALKKSRKTAARSRQIRDRSMVPERTTSRGATPEEHYYPTELPYFSTRSIQRLTVSPQVSFLAPQAPSMRPMLSAIDENIGYSRSAMSPSATSLVAHLQTSGRQEIQSVTPILPIRQSPMSLAVMQQSNLSASPTPDEVNPVVVSQSFSPWKEAHYLQGLSGTVQLANNPDFAGIEDWQHEAQPHLQYGAYGNADLSEQHPEMGICLSDLELSPIDPVDAIGDDDAFKHLWQ